MNKKSLVKFYLALWVLGPSVSAIAGETLRIMAYNTQNTFDADHDEGKDDYTFLPLGFPDKAQHCAEIKVPYYREFCLKTDWTANKVEIKLGQLMRMISYDGSIPDVVALEEVENARVVERLASALGYRKFLITDSPDARGIDVALMFNENKIRYLDHKEIEIKSEDGQLKTRNILQVNFKIRGHKKHFLGIYVNHWPSQSKPVEMRMLAAKFLKADIQAQQQRFGKVNYHVMAIGDFNTTEREVPNSIKDVLIDEQWENGLVDANECLISCSRVCLKPMGTYFYAAKFRFERLDRILLSRSLLAGGKIQAIMESFTVVKPPFGVHNYTERNPKSPNYGKTMPDVPIPYNFDATDANGAGFSDHFPIEISLRL